MTQGLDDEGVVNHPSGVLGDLSRRREEIRHSQLLTLQVPRWEKPQLKIVFHPIKHDTLRRAAAIQENAAKQRDSAKRAQTEVDTNADLLINACEEIYAVMPDGKELGVGPGGMRTRFDPDLAIALGLPPEANARAVCRELFITEGDLLVMAREVSQWSGYREEMMDGELAGES